MARELVDAGLILPGDMLASASRGRPAEELHLRPQAAHFVGVKVTAERLYAVVSPTSLRPSSTNSRIALVSPAEGEVVDAIVDATRALGARHGTMSALGVGLGGRRPATGGGAPRGSSPLLGWSAPCRWRGCWPSGSGCPSRIANDVHA